MQEDLSELSEQPQTPRSPHLRIDLDPSSERDLKANLKQTQDGSERRLRDDSATAEEGAAKTGGMRKPVLQLSRDGCNLMRRYESITKAAEDISQTKEAVRNAILQGALLHDCRWRFADAADAEGSRGGSVMRGRTAANGVAVKKKKAGSKKANRKQSRGEKRTSVSSGAEMSEEEIDALDHSDD